MDITQLEKDCNLKFNVKNFRITLEQALSRAKSSAKEREKIFYTAVYDPLISGLRNTTEEEFLLKTLPEVIKIKNETLELMYSPLFSIVNCFKNDERKLIDNLIIFYYYNTESQDFNLENEESQLANLFYNIDLYNQQHLMKTAADNVLIRVNILEPEYFEARYVNLLLDKIDRLERGDFSHDLSINLDTRSVMLIFYFLSNEKLLHKDLTLVRFFRTLQRGNKNKIGIFLKERNFTNEDIGYLWAQLKQFIYPNKKRDIMKWLNENFLLITKQDRIKELNDSFYKDYINEYKSDQDALTTNQENINKLIKDIKNMREILEADIYGGKD